ncbi:MAG: lamin tail domain-containing protein, partial [Akkermansiaceae bacterium]
RMENRINELANLMDPVGITSDADLDFSKWGSWRDGGSGSTSSSHRLRSQADRLINDYLPNRRAYLYGGSPSSNGLGVPSAQVANPDITIEDVEFLPSSGNQNEEYLVLKNRDGDAIDISGWTISGAVEHTFKAGTIIPAGSGNSGSQFVGLLHLAKESSAFRARSSGASGGQYRFIQGGYSGQLSARGETIELRDANGILIDSKTYTGTPSDAQNSLRITEINYHPEDPSAGELSSLPGITAEDFEFIELTNTGATALILDGASFVEGISFTFPNSTSLPAGQSIVVVKNLAAFQLRYGTTPNAVESYSGLLDNGGERIKLIDALGESILDFEYNDNWYPPSDGDGRTMVLRDPNVAYNDYDQPQSWGISSLPGGSPAAQSPSYHVHFEGWRYTEFSKTEREDPLIGMADSDSDDDGLTNWAEYCFGTNP